MWGGQIMEEVSWLFGAEDAAYEFNHDRSIRVFKPHGEQVVAGDVLVLTLKHLGVMLPTPFFALHTRGFAWGNFKLRCK